MSPRRLDTTPLYWALVGIPLLWGIWITVEKALVLFE
ncbi:MAG: MFS transporter small subunit [Methyloceanibacter sp.]